MEVLDGDPCRNDESHMPVSAGQLHEYENRFHGLRRRTDNLLAITGYEPLMAAVDDESVPVPVEQQPENVLFGMVTADQAASLQTMREGMRGELFRKHDRCEYSPTGGSSDAVGFTLHPTVQGVMEIWDTELTRLNERHNQIIDRRSLSQ